VGKRLLAVLCLGFLGIFSLPAAQGPHTIILIDTSGSMNYVLKEDKYPKDSEPAGQPSRIEAIKKPFKDFIDSVQIGETLHLYDFNMWIQPKNLVITIKKKQGGNNRGEAKQWVDKLKIVITKKFPEGPQTHLYKSIDEMLIKAQELFKEHGEHPSILIISDGKNSEVVGDFPDMASVLKEHKATIKNLDEIVICKIIKFPFPPDVNVPPIIIVEPENILNAFKPYININTAFSAMPSAPFIGQHIIFVNNTKTNPKKRKHAHLTPDKLKYEWDFGDNSPKSPENTKREPTHIYKKPGTWVVTLTVNVPGARKQAAIKLPLLDSKEFLVKPVTVGIGAEKKEK
jgi:hypothetical protein